MRIRHATTVALVGWYLIAPPYKYGGADDSPPMSKWDKLGSYSTAEECVSELQEFRIDEGINIAPKIAQLANEPRCIRADDPRLKW